MGSHCIHMSKTFWFSSRYCLLCKMISVSIFALFYRRKAYVALVLSLGFHLCRSWLPYMVTMSLRICNHWGFMHDIWHFHLYCMHLYLYQCIIIPVNIFTQLYCDLRESLINSCQIRTRIKTIFHNFLQSGEELQCSKELLNLYQLVGLVPTCSATVLGYWDDISCIIEIAAGSQ